MTKFDPTKPVQTRDGREAGIYATDGCAAHPIHGWYLSNGDRRSDEFGPTGKVYQFGADSDCDLINIPEKPTTIERWVRVGRDTFGGGDAVRSEMHLEQPNAIVNTIAIVPITITFTPGEGLTDED